MLIGGHAHGRRGHTLIELLVALALAAIVLGTATSSLLRQQRTAASAVAMAQTGAQFRAAAGALGAELGVLAVASGDLVPGELRDTALELRSLVSNGIACDDGVGGALLAEVADWAAVPLAGKAGDSLWAYAAAPGGGWRGAAISSVENVTAGCAAAGGAVVPALRVTTDGGDSIRRGAPLRVTRAARYVFYRSGDGSWQLGLREWSATSRRLGAPQPVAGPFLLRAAAERSGFRYFDAEGIELPLGGAGADADRVARIRVSMLSVDRSGAARGDTVRRDELDIALSRPGVP